MKNSHLPILPSLVNASFAPQHLPTAGNATISINKSSIAPPAPDAETPDHELSLFEVWSNNLSHGDHVLWVLEHKEQRFLVEEILFTETRGKTVNIYLTDINDHVESTSPHAVETVLVIKPDDQSMWSYWLHKSLGLEESQTLNLADLMYSPGSLKLRAALHMPPEPMLSTAARLLLTFTQ